MKEKIKKLSKMQLTFFGVFFILSFYYLLLKSELYESKTALLVKDFGVSQQASSLGLSLLGMGSSSQLQDSKIVEEYLKSLDIYTRLDAKFGLSAHYKSDALDFWQRRSEDATQEELVAFYNTRLVVHYDEISGILHIAFAHVEPQKAKEILEFLVLEVEAHINELNRINAKKQLDFIEQEYAKAKVKMDTSSKFLEEYQNKNLLLDPSAQASATTGVIASLEATLTQKNLEYATMKSYLNEDSYELRALKNEIGEIQKSIAKQKKELSGTSDERLNKVLFEYEKLKMQLEFDTEVYKNALLQLETTKLDVSKNAKTLSIISKPNMPDGYTYPNKPKVFITILIVMLLTYGIFSMLISIIKDHKE
jgi:capsular polysaccharide transport system permease protein